MQKNKTSDAYKEGMLEKEEEIGLENVRLRQMISELRDQCNGKQRQINEL